MFFGLLASVTLQWIRGQLYRDGTDRTIKTILDKNSRVNPLQWPALIPFDRGCRPECLFFLVPQRFQISV